MARSSKTGDERVVRALDVFVAIGFVVATAAWVTYQASGRQTSPPVAESVDYSLMQSDLGPAISRGSEHASVVFIEFSDYQCPFCSRFARDAHPGLVRRFVETGLVRHLFLDYPLEEIHSQARRRAKAARCAGRSGRYWEMYEHLFAHQSDKQADPALIEAAEKFGLPAELFSECLREPSIDAEIDASLKLGDRLGITSTPSFLIGEVGENGRLAISVKISGARSETEIAAVLTPLTQRTAAAKALGPVRPRVRRDAGVAVE